MAGHIAASGGLIKTNFRPIQTSRRPKRNSIGPKGSKKDSIAISMESILRNGKWLRRDNELSDPSSDRRRVAPSGYAPLIHGAGSDNRPFQTKELIHPLCSFAAANLASRRGYWRECPGDHSHPGFVFQRSIFGPHDTATPRPLNAIPCPLKL
jgi:hypothetical protein